VGHDGRVQCGSERGCGDCENNSVPSLHQRPLDKNNTQVRPLSPCAPLRCSDTSKLRAQKQHAQVHHRCWIAVHFTCCVCLQAYIAKPRSKNTRNELLTCTHSSISHVTTTATPLLTLLSRCPCPMHTVARLPARQSHSCRKSYVNPPPPLLPPHIHTRLEHALTHSHAHTHVRAQVPWGKCKRLGPDDHSYRESPCQRHNAVTAVIGSLCKRHPW
jgi:hypothetical protein